jgi:hypothetical protein
VSEQPVRRDSVHPERGTKRYRRNCSLAIRDGHLVVTDRHRNVFNFLLDGTPRAPAAYESMPQGSKWLVVDGEDRALVVGPKDSWDSIEMDELFESVGIETRWRPDPLPPLREDGVRLKSSPWPYRVAALPPIGLVGVVLARLDIVPAIPVLIFAGLTTVAMLGLWASGFFAPARRGPGIIAGEKLMAELQAKAEAKKRKKQQQQHRRRKR